MVDNLPNIPLEYRHRHYTVAVKDGLRIHVCPKNALSSIYGTITGYRNATPEEEGDELRFMVVRHPGDRMVSAWAFLTSDPKLVAQGMEQYGYYYKMPFSEFFGLCINLHNVNQHTRKQIVFAGPHKIDWLCPIEKIQENWPLLRERFDFLQPLPYRNKSEHSDWRDYFDNSMRIKLEMEFKEDMELYENAQNAKRP